LALSLGTSGRYNYKFLFGGQSEELENKEGPSKIPHCGEGPGFQGLNKKG